MAGIHNHISRHACLCNELLSSNSWMKRGGKKRQEWLAYYKRGFQPSAWLQYSARTGTGWFVRADAGPPLNICRFFFKNKFKNLRLLLTFYKVRLDCWQYDFCKYGEQHVLPEPISRPFPIHSVYIYLAWPSFLGEHLLCKKERP